MAKIPTRASLLLASFLPRLSWHSPSNLLQKKKYRECIETVAAGLNTSRNPVVGVVRAEYGGCRFSKQCYLARDFPAALSHF